VDVLSPQLIFGVVNRALSGAVGIFSNRQAAAKEDALSKSIAEIDRNANQLILSASATLEGRVGDGVITQIASFLRTREAEQFLRIFVVSLLTGEYNSLQSDLEAELSALLYLIGGLPQKAGSVAAPLLLRLLIAAYEPSATRLRTVDRGEMDRQIRRANFDRESGLLDSVRPRAELLRKRTTHELVDISKFTSQYRTQARKRYSQITPPYFDVQRRIDIDKGYVPPRITGEIDSKFSRSGHGHPRTMQVFVKNVYRAILLGNPGAGKSTFLRKIAYDHAQTDSEVVPFMVELRSYESSSSGHPLPITTYLEQYIAGEFQIPVPPGAIEFLLLTGRGLVLFDGLDELTDMSKRRLMVDRIEGFCHLYSTSVIISTSRSIGYMQAPLDPKQFAMHNLLEFDTADVTQYVTAWFSAHESGSAAERDSLIENFLRESETVPDLRINPLMLGLLCNVYRRPRTIPQNRAELYERCALMLFEDWDRGRNIASSPIMKAEARDALSEIALWVYTKKKLG
jgi:hypothetical protein